MVFNNSGSLVLFEFGFSNLGGSSGVFGNWGLLPTLTLGISSGSFGSESGSNHPPNSLISTLPFQ
jgi:hypothetical protein